MNGFLRMNGFGLLTCQSSDITELSSSLVPVLLGKFLKLIPELDVQFAELPVLNATWLFVSFFSFLHFQCALIKTLHKNPSCSHTHYCINIPLVHCVNAYWYKTWKRNKVDTTLKKIVSRLLFCSVESMCTRTSVTQNKIYPWTKGIENCKIQNIKMEFLIHNFQL